MAEYAFADLGGDERLELLVTSGGNWINDLKVVSQSGTGFRHQDVDAYEIDDLPGSIVRLDTSGRKEVIVTEILGSIARNGYPPVIPHVYTWNGTELVRADREFSSYCATAVLPDLRAQLHELYELEGSGSASDRAETARHKEILKLEIAAVKQLIH